MALKHMVEIERWNTVCEIEKDAVSQLFSRLDSAGYRSVSLAVARGVSELFGSSDDMAAATFAKTAIVDPTEYSLTEPITSDIFLPNGPCVLHIGVSKIRAFISSNDAEHTVDITAAYAGSRPAEIDQFVEVAQEILRKLNVLPNDKEIELRNATPAACEENLDKLPDDLKNPTKFDKRDLFAAVTLSDKANRDLVLEIRSKSPVIMDDIIGKKGGPAEPRTTKEKIDELVWANLLQLGVAAICKKASRPVVIGTTDEISESKARCPSCGNLPKDENIVDIVEGTDWSETLVLKSRWMMVQAIVTLARAGVPASSIRVPPEDARSDLLDLAFCFDGKVHLVELKDDEFRKQHAAAFAPRLMKLSSLVNVGVVACTGPAEDDAKELIEQVIGGRRPIPGFGPLAQHCEFLEGDGCVTSELQDLLRHDRLAAASFAMRLHGAGAGIDPWVILYKKLLS